jgi:hypothetical protein
MLHNVISSNLKCGSDRRPASYHQVALFQPPPTKLDMRPPGPPFATISTGRAVRAPSLPHCEQKAIVAIARKLLVVIWHVLNAKVAHRRAEPQQVARYFIHWGRQLWVKTILGIKASVFARQHFDRLQLCKSSSPARPSSGNTCWAATWLQTSLME